MSRYRGPKGRILKRLGVLPGFGWKLNQKFRNQTRQDKKGKKKKESPYTLRLKEKQKLRYHYGLTEKSLLNYVQKARQKTGRKEPTGSKQSAGELLLKLLELRLDNIVFRCGYVPTIPAARQLITHGHILLNGKKRNKPSSQCQINDIISIQDTSPFRQKKLQTQRLPKFLNVDTTTLKSQIIKSPHRQSIGLNIHELLVLEFYSRS